MTEYIFEVYREYESRVTDREFAVDKETAQQLGRNMVHLTSAPNWIEVDHWKWKIEGYGEMGENCYIIKHTLKGGE